MTSTHSILVPLDGSECAVAAVPVARRLAELLGATVVLLHVSEDALRPRALVQRMRLADEDIQGSVVEQRPGPAARVITREASGCHAALIVMCPRIWTGAHARTFGRVAEGVLRTAPCPVVLVPPARGRGRWNLHRLLVPHDGTPTSAMTMRPASDFAARADAELIVLHVVTPVRERPSEPGTMVFPCYIDQPQHAWPAWAREFIDRLRAISRARNDIKVHLAVAEGEPGEAIVNFARQADLVVLGWRGLLEPHHALTMQRVIRDAACPVVVFRLDGGEG